MSTNPLDIGLGIKAGDIIKLTFDNYSSINYTNIQFPKFITAQDEFSGMYDLDSSKQPNITVTGTIDLPSFASFLTKHKVWIKRFWFQATSDTWGANEVFDVLKTPIKLMHEGIKGHGSYVVKRFILDPYQKQTNIVVVNSPFLLDQHNFIQATFYQKFAVSYWFEIDEVI